MSVKLKKNCGQKGTSNLFEKIQKLPLFFVTKIGRKKLAWHITQVNADTTISSQNISIFKFIVQTGLKNIFIAL